MELKSSRDILQALVVHIPSVGALRFRLEDGVRKPFVPGQEPSWVFKIPEETKPIPFSSIAQIQISLSSMLWSNPLGPLYESPPGFTADNFMILKYSGAVSAVFDLDDSVNVDPDSIPGGLFNYVYHNLISSGPNMTTNYNGPEFEITLRLIYLEIRLIAIKDRLDVLGINYEQPDGEEDEHSNETSNVNI